MIVLVYTATDYFRWFTLIRKIVKVTDICFYTISVSILGEMIDKLTLTFNRTRQAVITGELIEIISGAAAL